CYSSHFSGQSMIPIFGSALQREWESKRFHCVFITPSSLLTDAPRPLSRPVRNSLIFKTDSIIVEESKPIVRLTTGFRQQERCHRACNQLKIPSIELKSFSLGIEILWLANGCENIWVAMVEYR
ncbi:hypothetical protein PIB30_094843, partial [Stylosanthes scabra]|nr:hypothetical protein [Stylosanthes scabra]